ncbi:MAG: oligosaccharide flippase family protein [Candidatus Rokubacteria bacterium]|nr:oligosaccharide flippase family protein [Candidatus Rokubacteria bacterium]
MTGAGGPGLRARTLRSFLLLGAQRVLGLAVTAIGGIVLARLLAPEAFGVYAIISFAVGLGVAFSDLGLGAALVQRRDLDPALTLGAAFSANLAVALLLATLFAALVPQIGHRFGLAPDAAAPLRALVLLIPLSALRMPATVLLERHLAYLPLTIAETLDTLVFNVVAGAAAFAGAGVWSFVLGGLAARAAGLGVLWFATPWRPSFRWRWRDLRPVVAFGVLFQGSAIITTVRDAVLPTFVAARSGVAAVGLLNWASSVTFLPLQVVSLAGKVLFPALSRLQHEPRQFAEALERALNRVAVILYPALLLLLAGAEPIVRLVYGDPWLPAVPAIRFLAVSALLGGTSTVLVHGLWALGRADIVFRLNLMWTALLWGLAWVLVPALGFVGFAVASACLGLTAPVTFVALRRLVPVRVLVPLRVPLAAAAASALLFGGLARIWVHDLPSLVLAGCAAGALYVGLAWMLGGAGWRAELLVDWRAVWQA